MATNVHGLEAYYFRERLQLIVRDAYTYTPSEMYKELTSLAAVAIANKEAHDKELLDRKIKGKG